MSSTIFYKFRSQKGTSRILFDGTGITVFDLKREIIQENRLGDGMDFQLRLYNPDSGEELEDDSYVVPRSSNLEVRRSPAIKVNGLNGRISLGNATRYVTGKPRVMKTMNSLPSATSQISTKGMNEDDAIASMFANQENQWQQTQQEMSSATPIFHRTGAVAGQDDGPPPPGYMCYRCGGKDHWIKNCPTNSDPNFEGKRIRRTTGIPKKFLKSVDVDPSTMTPEEMAQRKIMVTDDGSFVVQVADQHSWEDYQRKQQSRALNQDNAIWMKGHFSDLPEDLKCPITGGLLKSPVKTSKCCKKHFSRQALEDLLVENDFVCPGCNAEETLLDSLIPDEDKEKQVQKFLDEHSVKRKDNDEEGGATKKPKVAMPVPPFGMPFPMFPMPFLPNMNPANK
ncbi:LANO_0H12816g1_1 [Lachancea nothofagi CBS 11611]|uniref:LANO_0H12816g1_1 n=1 Tax=Lachancea nothofagi CBS 11611 TaxID=1266666 RepID=A0A1G4KMC2_9SACH|nr:LANO_0H12816g1_1 [Lachancea nothofagi CBS 11611]